MAEIICHIYIFHLTSVISSHYLVKHKSTKFDSSSGKTVKFFVRTSYFHQFINFW